jgi:hypothetical protein
MWERVFSEVANIIAAFDFLLHHILASKWSSSSKSGLEDKVEVAEHGLAFLQYP